MELEQGEKGGPYSKNEKNKRQNEVYRLHFERGYSAIKISEMMKINRNTINKDITYWYSILGNEWNSYDVESWCMKQAKRLESQRSRLFIELDKVQEISTKLAIEKMILDIDIKMMNFVTKTALSRTAVQEKGIKLVNKWLKRKKADLVVIDGSRLRYATRKTTKLIEKMLEEDLKQRRNAGKP